MIISIFLVGCILLPSSLAIQNELKNEKTPFSLFEALYHFRPAKFYGRWISDNQLEFFDLTANKILIHDANSGQTQLFLDREILPEIHVSNIRMSPDRKFALITYNRKSVYRHSSLAQYYIHSIEEQWNIYLANKSWIQVVEWAPIGHALAYVMDNNLYYVPHFNNRKIDAIQITNTGVPDVIFNGVPDWVYEEEVIGTNKAFHFSPSGDKIIFAVFNDSKVPQYQFPYYGEPGEQYPKMKSFRYPKAGQTNPLVTLKVYSTLRGGEAEIFPIPSHRGANADIYFGVKFVNDNLVLIGLANRVQTHSWFALCLVQEIRKCYTMYEHINHKGWADREFPKVSRQADRFLKIVAAPYKKNRSFPHLAVLSTRDGCTKCGETRVLTQGKFAVMDIIAWDEDNQVIYYAATAENEPATKHVYSVLESGEDRYCLSCNIISPEGRLCTSAEASFSPQFSYVLLTCTGPDPAITYLYRNTRPLGTPIIMEDNYKLRLKLQKKILPDQLNIKVKIPGPFEAEVRLFLPPNFDPSGRTKYPLINHVYGGPESQEVTDKFEISYTTYLVTSLNIIVAKIDARGSAHKELEMMYAIHRKFGTIEVEDQISVISYLQKRFPFIDKTRTGIWGWSYGGYLTIKALLFDNHDVFKCGISVAPASDFLYYDTIYTERYLGLPTEEDNLVGYKKANTYTHVNLHNLDRKKLFLIHGNADDNVHFQHSMIFAKILQRNSILFQQQSYPDENHHLDRVAPHFYLSMADFWVKCFNLTRKGVFPLKIPRQKPYPLL